MSALEGRDLPAAIEHVAKTITAGSGVAVSFDGDGRGIVLDVDRQQHCVRIAQEAIANAVKHGRPSTISVRLTTDNGHAVLTVHDDGAGFDPAACLPAPGVTSACSACANAPDAWEEKCPW